MGMRTNRHILNIKRTRQKGFTPELILSKMISIASRIVIIARTI